MRLSTWRATEKRRRGMVTAAVALSGKDINENKRIFSVGLRMEARHVVRFGAVAMST